MTPHHFASAQNVVSTVLKILIVASVLMIAWRRRALPGLGVFRSIACAWIIFFVFSPGVCAQYLVWLAPFILLLSPTLHAYLVASSSVFLFFFYHTLAGSFPWYLAISTKKLNTVWTPWSLWPWAVLIVGMVLLWKKARRTDPTLHLFSLKKIAPA